MMVSVKSNDASLRLLISVFMISKYAKCCRWTSGSAPVLYPGRHTPQGRRLAYRTSLSNSTTHGSRWMVRVHTNNSHTKQCHIVSGPQSLTMTQTCYHPPKFRNEFPKYYRSNTVYTCNSTANSQSITAIYQPAQQGHSAFSYATCTSFHLPVPWDPRPIEGRNQAHDEEKVSLDRLKDLHGKPNEVVHDEQQTKHLANTWPSCFRPF